MTITKTISAAVAVVALALFFAFSANTAAAQSYTPQSQQELIAYLYGIIAQLEAGRNTAFVPAGSVLGATTAFGASVIDIQTFEPNNIDGDEAWVYGAIDLNGAAFATVYFEYGESRNNLRERSARGRIDRFTNDTFRGELDGLDRGERYFYRAVAEDPQGRRSFGRILSFEADDGRSSFSRNDDDEPDAETDSARDIDEDSAQLRGEVDMNDFRNGLVFFAFGEDEDDVEDVDREDEFRDIDERGDDLQLVIVDRDLDDDDDYRFQLNNLDDDTEYFFRICVEYEDEDDDETLECGQVEEFETDRD